MNDYNRGALPDPCLRLDYGFGDEWKSVELGDGTGYVRFSDYEKLKAENARMRWKLEVLKDHGIEIVDAVAGGCEIYSDDHKEVERLKAANAKLRRAFAETLLRLAAANEATVSDYMDDHYCEMLREMGIEVDE